MKQSFARPHSHHRNHTPSVICLPPPRPPVAVKRPVEVEAVIALPDQPEPLVSERVEASAPVSPPLSRQARRKAQRAEAKALRRQGHPSAPTPATTAELTPPPAQATLELEPGPEAADEALAAMGPVLAATVAELDAETPLPPARALVAARPRGLALVAHKLRGMLGLRRPGVVPAGEGTIATQLRALRSELAALQKSVDRMIDGVAA